MTKTFNFMAVSVAGTTFMSVYSILTRGAALKQAGIIVLIAFTLAALTVQIVRKVRFRETEW